MPKTKEIRWFFQSEKKEIRNWFDTLDFDSIEKRNDKYLYLDRKDVTV